jgi:hypothetical protein
MEEVVAWATDRPVQGCIGKANEKIEEYGAGRPRELAQEGLGLSKVFSISDLTPDFNQIQIQMSYTQTLKLKHSINSK